MGLIEEVLLAGGDCLHASQGPVDGRGHMTGRGCECRWLSMGEEPCEWVWL